MYMNNYDSISAGKDAIRSRLRSPNHSKGWTVKIQLRPMKQSRIHVYQYIAFYSPGYLFPKA